MVSKAQSGVTSQPSYRPTTFPLGKEITVNMVFIDEQLFTMIKIETSNLYLIDIPQTVRVSEKNSFGKSSYILILKREHSQHPLHGNLC